MAPITTAARRAATAALLRATPTAASAVARRASTDALLGATPTAASAVARRASTDALLGATHTAASAVTRRASTDALLGATPVARRASTDATSLFTPERIQTVRSAKAQVATSVGHSVKTSLATIRPRPVSCLPHSARSVLSAPTYQATGGWMISRRGIASQPETFSPELKEQLQCMEAASEARYRQLAERLNNFEAKVTREFAVLEVEEANKVLKHARVGWRSVWGSLTAATVALWFVLHTKSIWIRDFEILALILLTDHVVELMIELEKELKLVVRDEMEKRD